MFIRPARAEEASALTELAMRSKAHWGYDDEFLAACRDELTIRAEHAPRIDVAELDGRVVGMVRLELETLEDLFVEPDAIGTGVGAALFRHVARSVGPDRVSLITDAMAATGMVDGVYHLGPVRVDVVDGVARVAGTDTIAGSTATMDRVFRFAVNHCGLAHDDALMLAVRQASINPARALGLPCSGLVPGASADLVVLDTELAVTGVLHKGSWEVSV